MAQQLREALSSSPASTCAAVACAGAAGCAAWRCVFPPVHPKLAVMQQRMGKTMGALEERNDQDREAFTLRPDDVVVAVPGKSGTTWSALKPCPSAPPPPHPPPSPPLCCPCCPCPSDLTPPAAAG